MKKKTTKEFIDNCRLIHGNKYDYSLVNYVNNNVKIKIICPIHGEFEQTPNKHLNNKQNCPKCSMLNIINKQKKTTQNFINESRLIHEDKYDYSLVDYINNRTKVKIICSKHGIFEQTPTNHLSGKGCLYCGGTHKMDTKSFINKSKLTHGDKYDYSIVNYINSQTHVTLICSEHGSFKQLPNNHLSKKQGCYKCLGEIHDNDSFKNICSIIHDNKYDYSKVDYVNSLSNVIITCPIHGDYEQRVDSHKHGNGCQKCSNNGLSKPEIKLKDFIKSLNITFEENSKKIIPPLELDIFIPSYNIAIEYNGLYWHSEIYKDKNYHLNKTELCEKQNIKLIHIFEDEWLFKQEIVKSRLKNILGLTENKIYGRKTIIKEVSTKETKQFLIENHIQGFVNSKINLGLYYNDELVSIMTFGGLRKNLGSDSAKNQYELLRFCNKLNTIVIGGADKLLKYFIKNYNPKEIISYADRRWSQGDLYEKLGFNFIHNSKPNYFYLINKKRENRFNYRKDVLIKQGFDSNLTEHQIMLSMGINRVYDCGTKKYCLAISTKLARMSAKFLYP